MIRELSRTETNSFYDPGKANNGGGYSQPEITFEFQGKIGKIEDAGCGDFGPRYSVSFDGKYYSFERMRGLREESTFTKEDASFMKAFNDFYAGQYTVCPLEDL